MKISELITELTKLQKKHGDLHVRVMDTHTLEYGKGEEADAVVEFGNCLQNKYDLTRKAVGGDEIK